MDYGVCVCVRVCVFWFNVPPTAGDGTSNISGLFTTLQLHLVYAVNENIPVIGMSIIKFPTFKSTH